MAKKIRIKTTKPPPKEPPNSGSPVKGSKRTVARSAKSGKFVKKGYAKKHPSTTVVERVNKPRPKK